MGWMMLMQHVTNAPCSLVAHGLRREEGSNQCPVRLIQSLANRGAYCDVATATWNWWDLSEIPDPPLKNTSSTQVLTSHKISFKISARSTSLSAGRNRRRESEGWSVNTQRRETKMISRSREGASTQCASHQGPPRGVRIAWGLSHSTQSDTLFYQITLSLLNFHVCSVYLRS